ncbi:MAG: hypothetical protein ACTSQE_07370 [Candidatus Heimdallarchaeaceae archaeon]
MGDYGFKVSKPGYDVKTCTDKQCVYTSKYGSYKTRMSGSISLSSGVKTNITHNFGYNPNYFVFIDDTDSEGNSGVFPMGGLQVVFNTGVSLTHYTDANNLYVTSQNTATAYYYIFAEKGSDRGTLHSTDSYLEKLKSKTHTTDTLLNRGDHGFRISEPGVNVLTAKPDELLMSSKYPNFKELASGSFTFKTGIDTQLNGGINSTQTTITVDATTDYSNTGVIYVGDGSFGSYEAIKYTGKTSTTFTGCTRGYWSTTAQSWSDNDSVAPGFTIKTAYTHSLSYSPVAFTWGLETVYGNLFALPYITSGSSIGYYVTSTGIEVYRWSQALFYIPAGGEEWGIKYHCMYDKVK